MNRIKVVSSVALLAGVVLAVPITASAGSDAPAAGVGSLPAKPHVVEQADRLTGKVVPLGQDAPVKLPAFVDGCDRGYGTPLQCVPVRAPGNRALTCGYLRRAGWLKKPLAYSDDHLHLVVHGRVCG